MITQQELLEYIQERISTLTDIREEMLAEGNHASEEYLAGSIDSYDVIRIKLTSGGN
jgi:hypothetical protein